MPRVPVYGPRKVEARPVAGVPVETGQVVPSAAALGGTVGLAQARFGETVANIGVSLFERQQALIRQQEREAKDRADQLAAMEAANQLESFSNQRKLDPQAGWLQAKGKDAIGVPEAIGTEFNQVADKISEGLANPRQKDAFRRDQLRLKSNLDADLMTHVRREVDAWDKQESANTIENARTDAISHASDPTRVADALGRQLAAITDYAKAQHLGPETTTALKDEALTKTHVGVITQLLAQDQDRLAAIYFEHAKAEIKGTELSRITSVLDAASTDGTGLRTATALWESLGPKSDSDPIQLDKMEEAARQQFADDPKTLKATIGYLRERKYGVDASRKDREDQVLGGLWKAATEGASLSQIRRTPEYLAAPGRVQAQISDYILGKAEHAAATAEHIENRAFAAESRAYTREQRGYAAEARAEHQREGAGLYMYYQYSNPAVLGQMSDAQIWALTPSIGPSNVARLLDDKHKPAKAATALDDYRSDTLVINSVLRKNGIDPTPKDTDKDAQAKIGWFQDEIAAEQRRVQGTTGKKLSNEELEAIASHILGQQVLSRGWWTDSTQPVMNATIADVPPVARTAIRASFQKQGVANPTDNQILFVWLDLATKAKK